LKDYTSVKFGIGPICRKQKQKEEQGLQELFPDLHAAYNVVKDTTAFIHIKDIGNTSRMSVTNDVKYVLSELSKQYDINRLRVFYTDSDGQIDEIVHKGKNFISFKAGRQGVEL
jgi:hypothetical protein